MIDIPRYISAEQLIEKHKDILDLQGDRGINCWEGWYILIDDMLTTMSNSVRKFSNIDVLQIKEKFGTLRVHMSVYDSYTQGIIDMAETQSKHTCEQCGAPGEMRTDIGRYKTLCLNHYTTRKLKLSITENR